MGEPIREALERLRMLALGNDYANEHLIRLDYEALDEALDALEVIRDTCPGRPAILARGALGESREVCLAAQSNSKGETT